MNAKILKMLVLGLLCGSSLSAGITDETSADGIRVVTEDVPLTLLNEVPYDMAEEELRPFESYSCGRQKREVCIIGRPMVELADVWNKITSNPLTLSGNKVKRIYGFDKKITYHTYADAYVVVEVHQSSPDEQDRVEIIADENLISLVTPVSHTKQIFDAQGNVAYDDYCFSINSPIASKLDRRQVLIIKIKVQDPHNVMWAGQ
jgi:hypothetical protein